MPQSHLRYPYKEYGSGKNNNRLDDYLYIRVLEYLPPGLSALGSDDKKTGAFRFASADDRRIGKDLKDIKNGGNVKQKATIILPIPDKVQDNNGAEWTAGNMNPLAAVIAGSSYKAAMSDDIFGQLFKEAGSALESTAASVRSNVVAATTSGLITNALFGQAGINQFTSRAEGQVFNQNTEFLFNGIQVRPAFQFTYDLTPRNKTESDVVRNIIRTFKYHMAPKSSSKAGGGEGVRDGLFVQAPDVFQLQYKMGKKNHPFLHDFKLCALTQMSVDYTGSGQHSTYADGTPVHIKLSLQFQELSPIFAEDQLEYFEDPQLGVGF